MHLHSVSVAFLIVCLSSSVSAQKTPFSGDSAYSVLKKLVQDIGPRPMGSPAERQALEFAVSKFSEFGCDSSYVIPMTVARGVNTTSGIAVGVLKGKTGRIIVIGGHIDTSDPEVPGANDDGSGSACVIELARVLAGRENQSTVMFCCWGGEEEGLRGSEYFVEHFDEIDSVVLMLQIDMADGSGELLADPDGEKASAPRWLVEASYEVFFSDLGMSGLVYPTYFAALSTLLGAPTGSDHASFLDKGIPAIDFTSDIDYPIHTPQDNLENFTASGLQRSGDLVYGLVEKFDGGVPARETEEYLLVQIGTSPVCIGYPLLWTFVVLSLLAGILTIVRIRSQRKPVEPAARVRWSLLKLLLCTLVIQTFIWYSENVVGILRGYRFPWVNNFGGFVMLGILFGLIALWVVLQLVRRFRLSGEAYVYARITVVLLFAAIVLALPSGPELAVFPAAAMLFFSLSMWVSPSGSVLKAALKVLVFAAGPYLTFRMAFSEFLGLVQRMLAANQIHVVWQSILYNSAFVLVFTLLSLPFVYGFAAVYRHSAVDLFWLRKFRGRLGIAVVAGLTIALVVHLSTRKVYDNYWFSDVSVEQRFTPGTDSSAITIRGSEFLTGILMKADGQERQFSDRTNYHRFEPEKTSLVDWCSIDAYYSRATHAQSPDSTWSMDRKVEIHSQLRPLRVTITYQSASPFSVRSPWSQGGDFRRRESDRRRVFSWFHYPDTNLVVPLTFALVDSQQIEETIEVVYDTLAYPLQLSRDLTNFTERTIVSERHTFGVQIDSTNTQHN